MIDSEATPASAPADSLVGQRPDQLDVDSVRTRVVRIAVLLPADRHRAWQKQARADLGSIPGVQVDVRRVRVPDRYRPDWSRLERATAILTETPAPSADLQSPGDSRWDAVIDLAGIDSSGVGQGGECEQWSAWRAASRHGVWQPLDAQGIHLAAAWPCHAAISAGLGGELLLVRDRACVLDAVRFFADPDYPRSFQRLYGEVATLLRGVVQELIVAAALSTTTAFVPLPSPTPLRRAVLGLRGKALAWRRRLVARWLSESWMIGVIDAPIQELIETPLASKIRWLGRRGSTHYRADPFGIPGDRHRLYCEVYDYRDGLGRIEAIELDRGDRIVQAEPARLHSSTHLSYPYLFAHDGAVYAIPETSANRRCELYRIEADGEWRPVAVLLDGIAAADASLFVHEGRFWLAYTDLGLGAFDNLCLSYAADLSGPWHPHALHPVKLDHCSSRPAGTPFVHGGTLYRPAQDCSDGYGAAIAINRIEVCTPQRYREQVVRRCRPDPRGPNPHGLHTVSSWGERTLVDGKRYVFNLHELGRKLRCRGWRLPSGAGE
ncbi:glucosamine inositolphosphorylceramide transferase family protein [Lysobacter sp. CA196]|uniref:glucosamine inositolphosphorylceramide transferase family protein n=1 Tax=Lysobacter sp. CA196 TaxID=3455606 RepID=UPI003F8D377C